MNRTSRLQSPRPKKCQINNQILCENYWRLSFESTISPLSTTQTLLSLPFGTLLGKKWWINDWTCFHMLSQILAVNPRRTCAARVTVLGLRMCICSLFLI